LGLQFGHRKGTPQQFQLYFVLGAFVLLVFQQSQPALILHIVVAAFFQSRPTLAVVSQVGIISNRLLKVGLAAVNVGLQFGNSLITSGNRGANFCDGPQGRSLTIAWG
jgi:hypothetical protein